ncbi:hypothetical protein G5714_002660 [Onychostoma macrolepis]|uniref:Uncharacterized protein n=1 Tax=Onychostoma macrolepis TaxID=369639 RepID=A0A7J6D7M5_9TELE|nr:hypothetical protein G5714_002660 [Onychostoma macrolepis]
MIQDTDERNGVGGKGYWPTGIKEVGKSQAKIQGTKNSQNRVRYRQGEVTAATWQFYEDMHEVLGARPSLDPPVVVASFYEHPAPILMNTRSHFINCVPPEEPAYTFVKLQPVVDNVCSYQYAQNSVAA